MGIFDFLKFSRNLKSLKTHLAFSKATLNIIGEFVEKNGFHLYKKNIETYFTTIIWKREEQYIKITASDYPTDYPYTYDIILGKGNSDDFFESEWDAISISAIKRLSEPSREFTAYAFPKMNELDKSLENAKEDLKEFGNEFLSGNLELFYKARTLINGEEKPKPIVKKDSNGKVIIELLPYNVIKRNS